MKPISLKIEEQQDKLLNKLSKLTHIPKSALVRTGIELVLRQYREGVITPEFRKEVDKVLEEDQSLLKKWA